jgi:multiple RNA-binding domain-containing protein 1
MLNSSQVSDEALPKSRRQQRDEKNGPKYTDYVPPPKENALKRKRTDDIEQDQRLKEFLEVMQPSSKTKMWANDDTNISELAVDHVQDVPAAEGESDDEYQMITKKAKTTQKVESPAPNPVSVSEPLKKPDMDDVEHTSNAEDAPGITRDTETAAGLVSDSDWLRSRTNRTLDLVGEDEEIRRPMAESAPTTAPNENIEDVPSLEPQAAEDTSIESQDVATTDALSTAEDKIRQTGRLYLRNLHYDVTSDHLQDHFSKYGSLEEVSAPFIFSVITYNDEYPKIGTTDALHMRSTGRVF